MQKIALGKYDRFFLLKIFLLQFCLHANAHKHYLSMPMSMSMYPCIYLSIYISISSNRFSVIVILNFPLFSSFCFLLFNFIKLGCFFPVSVIQFLFSFDRVLTVQRGSFENRFELVHFYCSFVTKIKRKYFKYFSDEENTRHTAGKCLAHLRNSCRIYRFPGIQVKFFNFNTKIIFF